MARVKAIIQQPFHHLLQLDEGHFELVTREYPMAQIAEFVDQFSREACVTHSTDVLEKRAVEQHMSHSLDGCIVTPAKWTVRVAVFVQHIKTVKIFAEGSVPTKDLS